MFSMGAIVAAGNNMEIGKDNKLLWSLKDDMAFFRHMTIGKAVIMGRKTHESIGKPLPGRLNIVVSKSRSHIEGCRVVKRPADAVELCREMDIPCMVIGGEQIYKELIDECSSLLLTRVLSAFDDADAYFPELDAKRWKRESELFKGIAGDRNSHDFMIELWERSYE